MIGTRTTNTLALALWAGATTLVFAEDWTQWRGPNRDGKVASQSAWPSSLKAEYLSPKWRVPLQPSYSGPIVVGDRVFVTETQDKAREVVTALNRATGEKIWEAKWDGSLTVPFFAWSNGSWIRSTPAYSDGRLYVAGIRDVLVCLSADDGHELWRIDFVAKYGAPLPSFGFVCSPLVDGGFVYVQAGAGVAKVNATNGEVFWRGLVDSGGMDGSAFSSPMIYELNGRRQLVVQSRDKLAGLDLETGATLWSQVVPAFRGMNILTPIQHNGRFFTSAYGGKTYSYSVAESDGKYVVETNWENKAQGYMSTPVIIGDFAYLHLRNQRFTCVELANGKERWTSPKTFGKYWSMVANGDRILALDQKGELLLISANPDKFEVIDSRKISDDETWAHLAICDGEVFVRENNAMSVFQWRNRQ